ncbi:adhesion G-protein coupled receptor G5-like [Halichoeres trimaculatus]|uniref:adhesion G-protein coupled receptor G5-like n=1 Tax=Halichoeres trimaculatus TaxID=147232 RepID=UPI003D9EC90B
MERWLLFGLVLSLVSLHVICKPGHPKKGPGKIENYSPGRSQAAGPDPRRGGKQTSSHYRCQGSDDVLNRNLITKQDQKQDSENNQICNPAQGGQNHNQDLDQRRDTDEGHESGSSENQSSESVETQSPSTDEDEDDDKDEDEKQDEKDEAEGNEEDEAEKNDKEKAEEDDKDEAGEDDKDEAGEDDKDEAEEDDEAEAEEDDKDEAEEDDKDEAEEDIKDEAEEDIKDEAEEDDKDETGGNVKDENNDEDSEANQGQDDEDPGQYLKHCKGRKHRGVSDATSCMQGVNKVLKNTKTRRRDSIEAMKSLEQLLERTEVNETTSVSADNLVALLYKPKGPFMGLDIYASENEAASGAAVNNSKVVVRLPKEIEAGSNNTVVFCMLTWPETNETSDVLYENRLVSISVRGKNISGLQERVNITINLTMSINESQTPSCRFLDFSTHNFSEEGCHTLWGPGQSEVTCSCDHLTYFGVLLVSSDISPEHLEILSYITLIGCSLSLFVLVITVLLFIMKRKVRADVSMKVHINLAISLILLNVHFLPSHTVAALASSSLCFYFALALHYSLLATFSWMALEGFHLYLLLVRVFNIYIRRYLLKLSVVGWGVPVVIVSLVVIIDRDAYGIFPLDSSNPNSTEICYIVNTTVKLVTTVGVFSLVFCFNLAMLGVTIRRVVSLRQRTQSGQMDRDRVKQDICTLLGVTLLLGIPWALVFFSFGYLTVPGLYTFCILNSLQGFFIFLWFLMSLRKFGNTAAKTSSKTQSTNG